MTWLLCVDIRYSYVVAKLLYCWENLLTHYSIPYDYSDCDDDVVNSMWTGIVCNDDWPDSVDVLLAYVFIIRIIDVYYSSDNSVITLLSNYLTFYSRDLIIDYCVLWYCSIVGGIRGRWFCYDRPLTSPIIS